MSIKRKGTRSKASVLSELSELNKQRQLLATFLLGNGYKQRNEVKWFAEQALAEADAVIRAIVQCPLDLSES